MGRPSNRKRKEGVSDVQTYQMDDGTEETSKAGSLAAAAKRKADMHKIAFSKRFMGREEQTHNTPVSNPPPHWTIFPMSLDRLQFWLIFIVLFISSALVISCTLFSTVYA